MKNELKTHLFTYRHDGAEWVLELKAKDAADARERIGKLAYATYDGELVARTPAAAGPFALLAVWLQNAAKPLVQHLGKIWSKKHFE